MAVKRQDLDALVTRLEGLIAEIDRVCATEPPLMVRCQSQGMRAGLEEARQQVLELLARLNIPS